MENHGGRRGHRMLAGLALVTLVALAGSFAGAPNTAAARQGACLQLETTIDGPYRTADGLRLSDGIIPLRVDFLLNGRLENIFTFKVLVRLTNCGAADLTEVVFTDGYDKGVQPYEVSDPDNVEFIWEVFGRTNPLTREYITWTVGTIPAGGSRDLEIKVGTEFNKSFKLEPTQGDTVLVVTNGNSYEGSGVVAGGAAASSAEGVEVKTPTIALNLGPQVTCAGTDGAWDSLRDRSGLRPIPHDRCAAVTTALPMTQSASTP